MPSTLSHLKRDDLKKNLPHFCVTAHPNPSTILPCPDHSPDLSSSSSSLVLSQHTAMWVCPLPPIFHKIDSVQSSNNSYMVLSHSVPKTGQGCFSFSGLPCAPHPDQSLFLPLSLLGFQTQGCKPARQTPSYGATSAGPSFLCRFCLPGLSVLSSSGLCLRCSVPTSDVYLDTSSTL